MAEATTQEINDYIEAQWPAFLDDAARLISIDSALDAEHAAPGAPFGPGPRAALDEALAIAARMGLETHDGEGFAGFADWRGESGQQLAVIGHVDVVPAGEGWTFSPFALTREGDVLVGRGITDDKGPVLCALYALKFWIDRGESLCHDVRFIFGCNEETGMADVPHYLAHNAAPDFLFTPDAEFPLCYGEKGLFGCTISFDLPGDALASLEGGMASNAVPATACAVVRADARVLPAAERITVEPTGEGLVRVAAQGVGAHASTPEGAVNAIAVLANYLLEAGCCSEAERVRLAFVAQAAGSTDGSAFNVAARDDDFGALTSVVGTVRTDEGRCSFTVDMRFPASTDADALEREARLAARRLGDGAAVEITRAQEPFVVNPQAPAVQALLRGYCEETGREVRPFTMGGATYAREFPHAVSFGACEPGAFPVPEWVGGMHAANEGVAEAELKRALAIYIRAFGRIAEVEDLRARA